MNRISKHQPTRVNVCKKGDRIFSVYVQPGTEKRIWIITEHDRTATTVLLPTEY